MAIMNMLTTILLASAGISAVRAAKLEIVNLEVGPMWVGIKGAQGKEIIEKGGFELKSSETRMVTVPDNWAGTIWPRTWCTWPKPNACLTGECGNGIECNGNEGQSPFSAVDIVLKGKDGLDYYAVSLANGYSIGVTVEPVNGKANASHHFSCSKATCVFNFQRDCPGPLRLRHENQVVACYSPCKTFATDEYCCENSVGNPNATEVCKSVEWRDVDPHHFKTFCPDALTYPKDEHTIFTCKADTYRIGLGGAW